MGTAKFQIATFSDIGGSSKKCITDDSSGLEIDPSYYRVNTNVTSTLSLNIPITMVSVNSSLGLSNSKTLLLRAIFTFTPPYSSITNVYNNPPIIKYTLINTSTRRYPGTLYYGISLWLGSSNASFTKKLIPVTYNSISWEQSATTTTNTSFKTGSCTTNFASTDLIDFSQQTSTENTGILVFEYYMEYTTTPNVRVNFTISAPLNGSYIQMYSPCKLLSYDLINS